MTGLEWGVNPTRNSSTPADEKWELQDSESSALRIRIGFGTRNAKNETRAAPLGEHDGTNGPNEGLDDVKPLAHFTVYTVAAGKALKRTNKKEIKLGESK
jgi:hypothetical protein